MIVTTKLAEVQRELSRQFTDVSLKGKGLSSFLYVMHKGRSLEISEHDGKLWLEFWEKGDDEDAAPVKEMTVVSSEQAVQETGKWLG